MLSSLTRRARSTRTASAFAGEPTSRTARSYAGPKCVRSRSRRCRCAYIQATAPMASATMTAAITSHIVCESTFVPPVHSEGRNHRSCFCGLPTRRGSWIEPVAGAEQLLRVTFSLVTGLLEHFVAWIGHSPDGKDHRPWAGVDGRVIDARFVVDCVRIDHREAFNDMNGFAEEISRLVQPRSAVLIGHVDHEAFPVPATTRGPQPQPDGTLDSRLRSERDHAGRYGCV